MHVNIIFESLLIDVVIFCCVYPIHALNMTRMLMTYILVLLLGYMSYIYECNALKKYRPLLVLKQIMSKQEININVLDNLESLVQNL